MQWLLQSRRGCTTGYAYANGITMKVWVARKREPLTNHALPLRVLHRLGRCSGVRIKRHNSAEAEFPFAYETCNTYTM